MRVPTVSIHSSSDAHKKSKIVKKSKYLYNTVRLNDFFCNFAENFHDMDIITVKDKRFKTLLDEQTILNRVKELGAQISKDYEGKDVIFLSILNGSFMFASDLMKTITIPSQITFLRLASYTGTSSTGKIKEVLGLQEDISGKHVVVVEDIVDTGYTMMSTLAQLREHTPASIEVCTLLVKPNKLEVDLDLKYVAFEIPDDFVVGYGLDYDQLGRNYSSIYSLYTEE